MPQLDSRETLLLETLISGASNRELATTLDCALRTAELHRQKVMKKFGAQTAAQLGYLYAQSLQEAGAGEQLSGDPALCEGRR